MKKVILSVFSLGMAVSATALTANTMNANNAVVVSMNDEKTAVKAEELPDAVKKTLAGDVYKDFATVEAFLIKSGEMSHYEVTLIKGQEKQVVKLNADGSIVK